jgi:hypothetical protein
MWWLSLECGGLVGDVVAQFVMWWPVADVVSQMLTVIVSGNSVKYTAIILERDSL